MASSSSSSSPEISHSAPAFDPSFFSYASLDDVLEELSTRFIMNLPDTELESVERMCFQVEQAHWYYEDFMREANPKLPSFNLKKFSSIFFNSCPLLRQWSAEHEQYFNTFMQYKVRVPVCGAIMLNDKWDKCILVKGWKSSAGWGFPKGKINQNEPAHECAAREVAEETGFNITSFIRPGDYIEMTIREQRVTLFIVSGIPEDYPFQTRTRKEISKIQWFKLSDLPSWKRNKQVPGKFYLISPFVHALKEFIRANKPSKRRQNHRKNGNDSAADLSIQTDPDNDDEVQTNEPRQQTSNRAVSLDRDVHGYSSSSVDNGEPQTPSPQAIEALPVATEVDIEGLENPMDPHFARLLNGLTLSASKAALNDDVEGRPTSITPTSAQSSLPSAKDSEESSLDQSILPNGGGARSSSDTSGNPLESSGVKSPSNSYKSDSSVMTIRSQSTQPTSSAALLPIPASDRHRKHLALLESVARELALSTPSPAARQLIHPGQPSSVPPMSFNAENSFHNPAGALPINGTFSPASFNSAGRPPPGLNDPFAVRPMTSQALFPSSPSVPRHGPNMSMHQGSLLSILTGPNHLAPNGPVPFRGALHSQGPVPYVAGPLQPLPFAPPAQMHTYAPQPLRVMPPPPGSFHLNPGPLTAPLAPPPGLMQPSFPQHGRNMTLNTQKTSSPNASQLLSLLNSNATARPISTTTLVADAKRPNFPSGSSAASFH
ncbi:DCP2 [Sanghuangporus weigelae]